MERIGIEAGSRMAAVHFPGMDVAYWYTDREFVAGEQLHHGDLTWTSRPCKRALAATAT